MLQRTAAFYFTSTHFPSVSILCGLDSRFKRERYNTYNRGQTLQKVGFHLLMYYWVE